jgi:hypothetical protein
MRSWLTGLTLLLAVSFAVAEEPKRFVERTPRVKYPPQHTAERAGNPTGLSRWAVLTPTPGTAGGYISGTYGTDHVGPLRRYGRIFRAPSADPSRGASIADNYSTDAAPVKDVFALRPFRKAVIEAKEAGHQPHR